MKLLPNTFKEYPLRFFIYWLAIWALLFLYSTVIMLPKISSNGYVVRKDVCLEETTTGRFDEDTECIEYGDPYYIPVGEELKNNFKSYGFDSFIIVFIIGWILRGGQKIEERKNKKPFNEILSDKRIINFLYSIDSKTEDKEDKDDEDYEFFKNLKKGKSLEELFKKNNDDDLVSEHFLLVEKKSNETYEIEFGIQYYLSDFDNGDKYCGGNSLTWQVTFDENDSAICGDEVKICNFD